MKVNLMVDNKTDARYNRARVTNDYCGEYHRGQQCLRRRWKAHTTIPVGLVTGDLPRPSQPRPRILVDNPALD